MVAITGGVQIACWSSWDDMIEIDVGAGERYRGTLNCKYLVKALQMLRMQNAREHENFIEQKDAHS
jgi:hypothetical protein